MCGELTEELTRQIAERDKRISELEQHVALQDETVEGLRLALKDMLPKVKEN